MRLLGRLLGAAFPWALAIVLTAALLLVARDSLVLCVLGIVAALVICVIVIAGPERAGVGFVVIGTMLAPMSALVVPGATFVTGTDLFYSVGFLLLLPTILQRNVHLPPGFSVTALLCLGIGLVASMAADDPLTSLNFQARFVAGVLILPLVFMLWRPNLRIVQALATAYVLGMMISLVGGVARGDRPGGRFIGFTEHPNVYGLTGLFATGLIVFMISQVKPIWHWAWYLAGAASLGVVWFSGSRAALVVAGALALAFPVVERSAKAAGWLIGSAAALLVVADRIPMGSGSALDRLLGGEVSSNSDLAREQLFRHYWDGFLQRPFIGHGFEESVLGHNVYLQMAFAMGVFGLAAFLALIGAAALQLLLAPKPLNRLAYPAVSYAMVAPLTSVVWDRYIWVPIALAFVLSADVLRVRGGEPGDLVPGPEPEPATAGGKRRADRPVDSPTQTPIFAPPLLRPRR